MWLNNKLKYFFVVILAITGCLAFHDNNVLAVRTNTDKVCERATRIAGQGTLSDGKRYVAVEYSLRGNDYARRFLDGSIKKEPGWYTNSERDNCSDSGYSGMFWDKGVSVNYGSATYQDLFQSVYGGYTSVDGIYLGFPKGATYDVDPSENYAGVNFIGGNDQISPYGGLRWRAYLGIVKDAEKPFATVNDSVRIRLAGKTAVCLGMAFGDYSGDTVCRGIDAASVYTFGGDFAGYLNWGNANARNNLNPVFQGPVANHTSIKNLLNLNDGTSFELKMYAQNTRDAVPGYEPWVTACRDVAPIHLFCAPPGLPNDPMTNKKGSVIITYVLGPAEIIPHDHFNLIPTVTLDRAGGIEAGTTITASPSVNNTGTIKSSKAKWSLKRALTPGSYGEIASDRVFFQPRTNTTLSNYPDTDTNQPIGTHICFRLDVKPASDTNDEEVRSDPVCVVIGKKPKVQVWGGDLVVGGKVMTSTTLNNGFTFGSWAEYGIIAGGNITGAGSGSAFAGTTGLQNSNVCKASRLSFTNTPTNRTTCTGAIGTIGNYTNAHSIPDVAASFPGGNPILTTAGSHTRSLQNFSSSGTYILDTNYNYITLNTSELALGRSIIIKATTGTVTIAGNQTYASGSYTQISQLPQLVIIAKKIIINRGVTNVDAWLIARNDSKTGSILTCDTEGKTIDLCNNPLTVNGPVMTDKLYLWRTAGSGTDVHGDNPEITGKPAEIFNLRADAYLWAMARASSNNGRIQSVYTTELPPRL